MVKQVAFINLQCLRMFSGGDAAHQRQALDIKNLNTLLEAFIPFKEYLLFNANTYDIVLSHLRYKDTFFT